MTRALTGLAAWLAGTALAVGLAWFGANMVVRDAGMSPGVQVINVGPPAPTPRRRTPPATRAPTPPAARAPAAPGRPGAAAPPRASRGRRAADEQPVALGHAVGRRGRQRAQLHAGRRPGGAGLSPATRPRW